MKNKKVQNVNYQREPRQLQIKGKVKAAKSKSKQIMEMVTYMKQSRMPPIWIHFKAKVKI